MRQDADVAVQTDTIVLIYGLWLIPAGAKVRTVPVWEFATLGDPSGDLGGLQAYWPKAGPGDGRKEGICL